MTVETDIGVWAPLELPDAFLAAWRRNSPDVPVPDGFTCGPLRALVGREPVGHDYDDPDVRWHISVSCEDRTPHWHELVDAAHALRPGVPFSIGIPPRSWWMSVHPYTLHLYETRDPHLVESWRAQRRGDRPS